MNQIVREGLEQRIPALRGAQAVAQKPSHGWLKAVRDSVGMSQEQVAKKLGIKRQSYAEMESAEARDSISLNSLDRAAKAMDCELVYFILPREKFAHSFGELAQLHNPSHQHLIATEHSMALEGQAVGDLKRKKKTSG